MFEIQFVCGPVVDLSGFWWSSVVCVLVNTT
jgi:hypothetical protein